MPYFVTDESAECSGWAVVKDDGEVMGCHDTKTDAIDQMVAISVAEGIEPGGERGKMTDIEIRTIETEPIELRAAADGDGMTFTGFAARYDVPSLPLPFVERIAPGAFAKTLRSRNDIRMYVNHDDRMVLGSSRAKTLRLEDRTEGLFVEADLPDTSYGRDLSTLISRGDVRTMSFGFSTVKDAWNADGSERTLREVRLHEVSVVTGVAAYPQTSASVRNLTLIAKRTETDAEALADAIGALESGVELDDQQADLLRTVIDRAHGLSEPAEPNEPSAPLSLLGAKLDLYAKQLNSI